MQQMDNPMNDHEDHNPDVIRAELVEEMEPGAPWEWREVRPVPPRRRRVWTPLILFVATCLSTLVSGHDYGAVRSGLVRGVRAWPMVCRASDDHPGLSRDGPLHPGPSLRGSASFPYFLPFPARPSARSARSS